MDSFVAVEVDSMVAGEEDIAAAARIAGHTAAAVRIAVAAVRTVVAGHKVAVADMPWFFYFGQTYLETICNDEEAVRWKFLAFRIATHIKWQSNHQFFMLQLRL